MNLHETITKLKTNPDHEAIQSSIQFLVELDRIASALDEHMVVSHLGVFNIGTDPKYILNLLACYEQAGGEYFAKDRIKELEAELLHCRSMLEDAQNKVAEACVTVCETLTEEFQEKESGRWPEMRTDASSGITDCAYLISNGEWKKFLPQQ
jgi:hypothetical protein